MHELTFRNLTHLCDSCDRQTIMADPLQEHSL